MSILQQQSFHVGIIGRPDGQGAVVSGTGDGSTSANAGTSALQIKQQTGTTTDGLYWIQRGDGVPFQVYCDMNTAGGGWMLIARTHPSAAPAAGTWGWRATSTYGAPTTFTNGYCIDLLNWFNGGFRFNTVLYGNQLNNISNSWGPFIYQVGIDSGSLMTVDAQMSLQSAICIKSDTTIYWTTAFPGMQGAWGFSTTGTANNNFYMRDCCGYSGYGIAPTGMVTTYCSDVAHGTYPGPFCNGATLSGNTYVQGGSSSASNTGGTNQCMIMVR